MVCSMERNRLIGYSMTVWRSMIILQRFWGLLKAILFCLEGLLDLVHHAT